MPELIPPPVPGVRCLVCGRTADCTASQFLGYSRTGFPSCCGAAMGARPLPGSSCDGGPPVPKRLCPKRPARPRAQLEVRRGVGGLGPDLAVGLVDVSEDGACVHLKESVGTGDEVEVAIGRPLGGKLFRRRATVRWCRAAWGVGFLAEVLFARRLSLPELNEVAQ